MMDYIVGLVLIGAPWIFGFADQSAATYVPVALGLGSLLYSLLTDYEMGVVKVIPFRMHLIFDVVAGLFLAASPWIFGFAPYVYLPHVIVGAFEILAGLTTKNQPADLHHGHRHHHA